MGDASRRKALWGYDCDGKEKLMSFGKYPAVRLALARRRHAEARTLLATGVDPMAQRKIAKTAERVISEHSFASSSKRWLEHWKDGKSPWHVDSTRRRLDANILPAIGHLKITEIETPDIVAMAKVIDARGARDIAKRAIETTGQVFRYAPSVRLYEAQSRRRLQTKGHPQSFHKVNHARVDVKELPNLLRQIEVYQGTHVTRLAMKLIALTFVRTSELIGAKWSEFDFEELRWDIPKKRMKMRTPHIVPLAKQTVETLATLRDLTGDSEWLFPAIAIAQSPCQTTPSSRLWSAWASKGE
jgi:integrase